MKAKVKILFVDKFENTQYSKYLDDELYQYKVKKKSIKPFGFITKVILKFKSMGDAEYFLDEFCGTFPEGNFYSLLNEIEKEA